MCLSGVSILFRQLLPGLRQSVPYILSPQLLVPNVRHAVVSDASLSPL
jgi:hypothetical protein